MKKQFYTYFYVDPRSNEVVYVGKGSGNRAWQHFELRNRAGERTELCKMIWELLDSGQSIYPKLHYEVDEQTATDMEMFWISFYGRADLGKGTLFNKTNGGKGVSGLRIVHSAEHNQRVRDAWKRKRFKESDGLVGALKCVLKK